MQADAEINIAKEASMKTKPVELEPADNGNNTESPTLNKVKRKRNASDPIMEATHKRPKNAGSSGDNTPVRPRNMKGGKKQGEPENAGSTGSDVSTGVFSVNTKPPVDYLKKLEMVIRVIRMAREWEKSLTQLIEALPDADMFSDSIKKTDHFSCTNTPQIQTGLGSPELQPLPKGGKMKRGRPGQRFGKRGEKEQITGKLYWHKRSMKLLTRAKKLLAGRKRRSVPLPSSPTREPPTPQGVQGPAAAEEVSPEPEPSEEELEPEIEESDRETPQVYAEVIKKWEWEQKKLGARHIGQEFRLVNLQNITSYAQAVAALHGAIQQVLDNVNQSFDAGDFVRMRFEGGDMTDPLFSVKLKGGLDADEFLSQLSSLLQSDMELCAELTLRLVVTIVKAPRGGSPSRCLVSTG